tara:strand:- start:1521 stop:1673 length:153 start_codon:yes stop_codon:yes gene_type:complete
MTIVAPDCSIATPIIVPNRINNPIFNTSPPKPFWINFKDSLGRNPEKCQK